MSAYGFLSWKRDLNPRPTDYESVALPTAPFQLIATKIIITFDYLFGKSYFMNSLSRVHPTVGMEL